MRFRQTVVQLQSPSGGFARCRHGLTARNAFVSHGTKQRVGVGQACIGGREIRIQLDSTLEVLDRAGVAVLGTLVPEKTSFQECFVDISIDNRTARHAMDLIFRKRLAKRAGDAGRDGVLEAKNIRKFLVKLLGPKSEAVGDTDQLHSNANPVSETLDIAVQNVLDAEPAAGSHGVRIGCAESADRADWPDGKPFQASKSDDEGVSHSKTDVFALPSVADYRKRQDRETAWLRRGRLGRTKAFYHHCRHCDKDYSNGNHSPLPGPCGRGA